MTEADILATTYEDTVTVYRAFKDTLPGGESVFKSGLDGKVVYEEVESCSNRNLLRRRKQLFVCLPVRKLISRPMISL